VHCLDESFIVADCVESGVDDVYVLDDGYDRLGVFNG
jgi:hypothetical protein